MNEVNIRLKAREKLPMTLGEVPTNTPFTAIIQGVFGLYEMFYFYGETENAFLVHYKHGDMNGLKKLPFETMIASYCPAKASIEAVQL